VLGRGISAIKAKLASGQLFFLADNSLPAAEKIFRAGRDDLFLLNMNSEKVSDGFSGLKNFFLAFLYEFSSNL
jgi:hypothetical protein